MFKQFLGQVLRRAVQGRLFSSSSDAGPRAGFTHSQIIKIFGAHERETVILRRAAMQSPEAYERCKAQLDSLKTFDSNIESAESNLLAEGLLSNAPDSVLFGWADERVAEQGNTQQNDVNPASKLTPR